MQYPLHTESKPVSGAAAQKLIQAIEAGEYVANDKAIALAKRIAERRHRIK